MNSYMKGGHVRQPLADFWTETIGTTLPEVHVSGIYERKRILLDVKGSRVSGKYLSCCPKEIPQQILNVPALPVPYFYHILCFC